ncbi:MAG: HEAT repeat domain-containing protein [archaeon]|nr:HEAT repeat domain-containing protein [archaeon]
MGQTGNTSHQATKLKERQRRTIEARKKAGASQKSLRRLEVFQRFQRALLGLSWQISVLAEEFGATKNLHRERYEHFTALFGLQIRELTATMSTGKKVRQTEQAMLYFSVQRVKEPRIIPILGAYLLHPNPHLRLAAVISLGYYGLKSNAKLLRKALNDRDPKVRITSKSWFKRLQKEGK